MSRLRSTLAAMRLCERLGVDSETAFQTYFLSLLFYVGCTAPVDLGWETFGDDNSFVTQAVPARFGTRAEMARGMLRAIAPPGQPAPVRAWRAARYLPVLAVRFPEIVAATCEVARMLTDDLGLSPAVSGLAVYESERWDGKGFPDGVGDEGIPLAVRIVHVARDAAFQHTMGDAAFAADVVSRRAGGAFDPAVVATLADDAVEILEVDPETSPGMSTLAQEPAPWSSSRVRRSTGLWPRWATLPTSPTGSGRALRRGRRARPGRRRPVLTRRRARCDDSPCRPGARSGTGGSAGADLGEARSR